VMPSQKSIVCLTPLSPSETQRELWDRYEIQNFSINRFSTNAESGYKNETV
jgi:hypothetical protein